MGLAAKLVRVAALTVALFLAYALRSAAAGVDPAEGPRSSFWPASYRYPS